MKYHFFCRNSRDEATRPAGGEHFLKHEKFVESAIDVELSKLILPLNVVDSVLRHRGFLGDWLANLDNHLIWFIEKV